ncbi:MAG: hypothetical protein K2X03_28570 [Bryobacteraceae bacterium]|nr:hypothetical protein [Bryobacteraceae bacterium]
MAIDPARGLWHDFVSGEGGGKLALIRKALGCSQGEAYQWLADFAGIPIAPKLTPSLEQRRAYAKARQEAAENAQLAIWWLESAREKLEIRKRLSNGFEGPWNEAAFEAASSALYWLSRLDAAGIDEAWAEARQADPAQTAGLEAAGRAWQARYQEVVTRIIQPWEVPHGRL